MNRNPRKAEQYRAANLEAARIIAADPERYGGIMLEWAAMLLKPPVERPTPATRRAE